MLTCSDICTWHTDIHIVICYVYATHHIIGSSMHTWQTHIHVCVYIYMVINIYTYIYMVIHRSPLCYLVYISWYSCMTHTHTYIYIHTVIYYVDATCHIMRYYICIYIYTLRVLTSYHVQTIELWHAVYACVL